MLDRPPVATSKEELDAFKIAFTPEIQGINLEYPYWDKVKYIQTKDKLSPKQLWFAIKLIRHGHQQ